MTRREFIDSIEQAASQMGDTDVLDVLGKIVMTSKIDTMATNAHNIFVSPSFAASITPKQAVGVLVHEMMHDGLLHHEAVWSIYDPDSEIPRGQWHELANIAEDIVINEWLVGHGYELPGDYCTRKAFTPPVKPESTTSAEMFSDLVEYVKEQRKNMGDIPEWLKKLLAAIATMIADKKKVSKLQPQKPKNKKNGSGTSGGAGKDDNEEENTGGGGGSIPTKEKDDEQDDEPKSKLDEKQPNDETSDEPEKEDSDTSIGDAPDEDEDDEQDIEVEDELQDADSDDESGSNEEGDEPDDGKTIEDVASKVAARAPELQEKLTVEKTAKQIEEDSYVPVKQTWIDRIFLEMGRYINYQMRERTYARPSRRPAQSLPGSDIVTPLRGQRQQGFSARAIFYLDVSSSMYEKGDTPNSIRAEIEKNSTKLRSTRSIVKPFATRLSQTPLDVSQWIDRWAVMRAIGFETNMNYVIDDINAQVGATEVYAIITDCDTPFNVDNISKDKKVFIVTTCPQGIRGDTTRRNITVIPVSSFNRGS